jgi:hypothetical protein
LSDGYPAVENLLNKEEVQKIRDKNAQSQKPAWDRFISYQTDAGKIETDDLITWRSATTPGVREDLTDLWWYFKVYVIIQFRHLFYYTVFISNPWGYNTQRYIA